MNKLDELLKVLETMTDDEIVKAMESLENVTHTENYLGDEFEIVDPNDIQVIPFYKTVKNMVCINKERYEELLEIENMYNDLCK